MTGRVEQRRQAATPPEGSRERAWAKYRKTRRDYLHDEHSFNAGWQAALSEGRKQGLEEAAKLCDVYDEANSYKLAAAIRALITLEEE